MSKKMITFCDVNGLEHDFPIDSVDYGTCSTQGSIVVKQVTCEGFSLYEGALIVVKFSYANTQYSIMMNVNGTGGKTVYFPDASSMSTTATGHIQANGCYLFVYDGTYWRFCGSSKNKLDYGLTLSLNGSSSTFNGASAVSKSWYAPTTAGTKGQVLKSNGSGAPTWGNATSGGNTILVAASNSSSDVKAAAKYVCDGTADQTEISSAITEAVSLGFDVVLANGDFNLSDTIVVEEIDGLKIKGSGQTKLTITNSTQTNSNIAGCILIQSCSDIEISDIEIVLQDETSNLNGIVTNKKNGSTKSENISIRGCYIHGKVNVNINCYSTIKATISNNILMSDEEYLNTINWKDGTSSKRGIGYGIQFAGAEDFKISGNTIKNKSEGIRCNQNCSNIIITENYLYNNFYNAIYLSTYLDQSSAIIDKNFIMGDHTDRTSVDNTSHGMSVGINVGSSESDVGECYYVITNNHYENGARAININGALQCIVSNNIGECKYTGTTSSSDKALFAMIGSYNTTENILISNNVSNSPIQDSSTDKAATIVNNIFGAG